MNRRLTLTVAAVIAAASTIVGFAIIAHPAGGTITVTAQFDNTTGLYQGNAVSLLGMQVGKATAITPKDNYVEVKLAIDQGVDIPADVQAVTVSTSILTDRHIELTPAYHGGPKLKNGDVVGLTRTRTPVEFDKSLAMVDKLARALGGDGKGHGPLADLVSIGAAIASRSSPDIKATLGQLSEALRLSADNGARSKKDIQAIITNLAELMQSAADNDTAIRQFGSNLRQLSDILADEDLGSGSTGKKVNLILARTASLLEKNRDGLKSTVADAQTLTAAINDYRREIAETFDVSPLLSGNIYNAIDTNAGSLRIHALADKILVNGQFSKEVCNLLRLKQLGCATGTLKDYGPDFGLTSMLDLMAGVAK